MNLTLLIPTVLRTYPRTQKQTNEYVIAIGEQTERMKALSQKGQSKSAEQLKDSLISVLYEELGYWTSNLDAKDAINNAQNCQANINTIKEMYDELSK